MGCQDLLEDVPGRLPRRDQGPHISSPADLRSFVRATGKGLTGRGSSKSYSIKEETSSKILFMNLLLIEMYVSPTKTTEKLNFTDLYVKKLNGGSVFNSNYDKYKK